MYNSYEEYMQSVLGVNTQNTYGEMNNSYFEPRVQEINLQEVNKLYPEIYGIVYPMVQKVCGIRNISTLNSSQIDEMVEEVYNAIEPGDDILQGKDNGSTPRNGDVKNPRARDTQKEVVRETRRSNNNYLLKDLIRILIIREILQGGGWQNNYFQPRPPLGGMQGMGMQGPGGIRKTTYNETTDIWECKSY